jgi:hypothetical protein
MKNRRVIFAFCTISVALSLGIVLPCGAEEEAGAEGPAAESPYSFDIGLRLFGVDVGVGYNGIVLLPGAQTTIWAYVGGGYETLHYNRDAAGNFIAAGTMPESDPQDFWRAEGAWRLGMDQGFAWNARTRTNLVEAFVFYRGRYNVNQIQSDDLLYASTLADRNGSLLNTLQAGIAYDDLLFEKGHNTKSGIAAEASVEWGPGFFLNSLVGASDFVRFNGTFRGFLPVYDLAPDRPSNLLSVYAGEYFQVDYIVGDMVPLYVSQSFGGRDQRTGLGGAVRGVDSAAYDAHLKAVNCLEVRANLPAIYWPGLVPGLVAFFDAGYYNQLGEPGTDGASGFLASAGAGVFIDAFDLGQIAAYVEYRIDGANADGNPWSLFAIEFGLHF